jgi:hypothetical protein
LPEFLDEEVAIIPDFIDSLWDALIKCTNTRYELEQDDSLTGGHFVHVVYDGDEPQAVVYHGETINDQLVEADHKRYNLQ